MTAIDTILNRKSIRRFLPTQVPKELIEKVLALASRAPSGTNVQPWKVYVLQGEVRNNFCAEIKAAFLSGSDEYKSEFNYFPAKFKEPFLGRRRKIGFDLYGLVGIEKGDKERMKAQHARNFDFFDAPVGLIFTIDKGFGQGSYLDCGMLMQNVMLTAKAEGLDTCPQGAFAPYHTIIRKHLGASEEETILCAMSLGYADPAAPENSLETERAPLSDFVTFLG
ncbi:MAG: nitroreductase [Rhodospirillales bacterium]|nr:nitroreductase [Rhodospirillales bacterium]